MTYPLSSAVSAGDPTEASQYNNLRADALCLGNDPETSGNMLQLLCTAMGCVRLSRTGLTEITLTASESEPCAVVISGKIYSVTESLTLTIPDVDMTLHGRYHIYAQPAADGKFTLAYAYAAGTAPDASRMIGTFLWDGTGIIPGTVRNKADYEEMKATIEPSMCCGRLSASASAAVPEADVSTVSTVYFHPYGGNRIGLCVGNDWEVFTFSRIDYSLLNISNYNVPYDIFVKATKNGLVLMAVAWASKTTRQVGLGEAGVGIKVLSSDAEQRYVGTIALDSLGRLYDTAEARMVWNQYNRVGRPLLAKLTGSSGATVHPGEWVPYFDSDAPSVRLIAPSAEADFEITGVGISAPITETDISSSRAAAVGLIRDHVSGSGVTYSSCVPVFTHTYGNGPMSVTVRNQDANFRGDHTYTLAFWTNYTFYPAGKEISACGECPGITGYVLG